MVLQVADMARDKHELIKQKANRSENDLLRKVSFERVFDKYTRHKTKIRLALRGTEQGKEMIECDDGGSLCGSIFCEKCGNKKQNGMFYSYNKRYKESFSSNETLARERLRWVSVLHSAVAIKVDTLNDELETLSKVAVCAEQMKQYISLLGKEADRMYDGDSGLWMRGGIHIEIIDYASYNYAVNNLGVGSHKQRTLKSFIDKTAYERTDFMFLVHFHGLFDMGNMSEGDFTRLIKKRWNTASKQTHITKLWEGISAIKKDANGKAVRDKNGKCVRVRQKQKIEHAFRGLANYCFSWSNINLEYKQNWGSGRYRSVRDFMIEVMDTHSSKSLTDGHIRLLVQSHNMVNGSSHRGLIVSIYD